MLRNSMASGDLEKQEALERQVAAVRAKVHDMYLRVVEDPVLAQYLEAMTYNATIQRCREREIKPQWDNEVLQWWYTHKALGIVYNLRHSPGVLLRVRQRLWVLPGCTLLVMVALVSGPARLESPLKRLLECAAWMLRRTMGVRQLFEVHTRRPHLLNPGRWTEAMDRAARKSLVQEAAHIDPKDVADGIVQCSRCRNRKVIYTEMQTRSADEPMTIFYRCVICDKSWKQ